ncbi:hypothetical protein V6N12_070772 [Hibiscus sabdariffa]|uniref:Uncharacterized protein n=1 Tax=Hibiscus sabdariffa TaxID=183260 RepID=A0ABR2FI06_9ROSI
MQEHRSSDAKKAVATPLMNHIATPSSFPHAADDGDPRVAADEGLPSLGSALFDRRVKKPEQLLQVLVAAMNLAMRLRKQALANHTE